MLGGANPFRLGVLPGGRGGGVGVIKREGLRHPMRDTLRMRVFKDTLLQNEREASLCDGDIHDIDSFRCLRALLSPRNGEGVFCFSFVFIVTYCIRLLQAWRSVKKSLGRRAQERTCAYPSLRVGRSVFSMGSCPAAFFLRRREDAFCSCISAAVGNGRLTTGRQRASDNGTATDDRQREGNR